MLLFLWACSMSSPSTLVDELRVMAIQSIPAEVSPLDPPAKLQFLIANPKKEEVEVLYWTCTNFGEGCLEKDFYGQDLRSWPQMFDLQEELSTHDFMVPPALAGIISELPEDVIPFEGTFLWVFACPKGRCSIFSEIAQGDIPVEQLASPTEWLNDYDFGEVSLAFRSLSISTRPQEERIQNPLLEANFSDEPSVSLEESLLLSFSYDLQSQPNEDSLIYGYTTVGGFSETDRTQSQLQNPTGTLDIEWFGPQEASRGNMYVILDNGVGGTSIWTSSCAAEDL